MLPGELSLRCGAGMRWSLRPCPAQTAPGLCDSSTHLSLGEQTSRHIQTTEILLPIRGKPHLAVFPQWEESQLFWGAFSIPSLLHPTPHTADLISQDSTVNFNIFLHLPLRKKRRKRNKQEMLWQPQFLQCFQALHKYEPWTITGLVNISFLGLQYSSPSQSPCFVAELNIPMACSCIISSLGIQNYSSH